ncbi:MAG: hypothetical protein K1X53_01905 [Candidatus Sumerlaeaceae bacterium]|nr:hypothetical protein [Candidatus Sumerlaeaceae bacterium]
MKRFGIMMAAACILSSVAGAQTTSSVQIAWDDFGTAGYFMSSFSPPSANVGLTGSGNLNPTLSLQMGKRYKFTYTNAGSHPLEVVARGATFASDVAHLSLAVNPSLESNSGIAWFETGSDFYFNITGQLADALNAGAGGAGYHCNFHPDTMRGGIVFTAADSNLLWPNGSENFENAVIGTQVNSAITSWSVVAGSVPANYTPLIASTPAGHPNQAAGSTRWLTVTDTDNSAAANGRTYTNSIIVPGAGTVSKYNFNFRMDVQSVGTTGPLLISQHINGSSTYVNVAGLEVTSVGLGLIIVGTDDGGAGKAGASTRTTLYNFADSGGFGQNAWIPVQYEIDLAGGLLKGTATGTDNVTVKNAQISGLALQSVNAKDFRFCIRGNGSGNVSTISFDNIVLQGTETPPSGVTDWGIYQ